MLTVRVPISDPDALLVTWGAGALARLEWSATETGSYTEVGTAALLSGLFEYYIVDPTGTPALWYRWRPSTAAPAAPGDYGAYSDPWVAGGPYLSTDLFRLLVTTTLGDEALQMLLNAAAEAIVAHCGPSGERTEWLRVNGSLLYLSRVPLSIASVTERVGWSDLTLSADDYEINGQTLRRLHDGTNPNWSWRGRITVVYTPLDDTAERQRVQMELVKLSLASAASGGGVLASQTIGTWSETYQTSAGSSYQAQREEILASLDSGIGFA